MALISSWCHQEYYKSQMVLWKVHEFLVAPLKNLLVNTKLLWVCYCNYCTMLSFKFNCCHCTLFCCLKCYLFSILRNYMNDSLRTNVFVRFSPDKIACACIFLAAREFKVFLKKFLMCLSYWSCGHPDPPTISSSLVANVWSFKERHWNNCPRDSSTIYLP